MTLINFSVTFILTILNIGILFFILRAILFKPVTRFMEARTARIQGELAQAEKDREEAKNIRLMYEQKMKEAELEAQHIVENAKKAAEVRAEQILAESRTQADALVVSARKQITAEQQAAYLLFKAEAGALVVRAASRLLKRELSGDDVRLLADTAIAECAAPRMGRIN